MSNVVSSEARRPETEVNSKARRRQFSAEYKRRILREAEEAKGHGELGAMLRREGLYSSHLATWRQQETAGQLGGVKRGPKPKERNSLEKRVAELERQLKKANARAERAEGLVELQKKSRS